MAACCMDSLVSTTHCSLAGLQTHTHTQTCFFSHTSLPLCLSFTNTGVAIAEVLFTPFLGCCAVAIGLGVIAPLNIVHDGRESHTIGVAPLSQPAQKSVLRMPL